MPAAGTTLVVYLEIYVVKRSHGACTLDADGSVASRAAAALITSVDISMLRGHDELASYCGVAPFDSRSGSCIGSTSPQRAGASGPRTCRYSAATPLSGLATGSEGATTSAGRGDETQQCPQGCGEEDPQGHLRHHAQRRTVRGIAGGKLIRRGRAEGRKASRGAMPKSCEAPGLTKP